jgi:hypothetical protein
MIGYYYCNKQHKKKLNVVNLSITEAVKTNLRSKVHLVTYAGGDEVYFRNQNALIYSAINKGVDLFYAYKRKHLDEDFLAKNKHILDQKRGAGYWLWKPYFILKTMEKAEENDIILYMDVGYLFNNKANNKESIVIEIANILNNSSEFALMNGLRADFRRYTKKDLIKYIGMEDFDFGDYLPESGLIFIKNTPKAREFVKQWLSLSESEQLLTDIPSINKEDDDFIAHRHDQSTLGVLFYKDRSCCKIINQLSEDERLILHRRRVKDHPLKFIESK